MITKTWTFVRCESCRREFPKRKIYAKRYKKHFCNIQCYRKHRTTTWIKHHCKLCKKMFIRKKCNSKSRRGQKFFFCCLSHSSKWNSKRKKFVWLKSPAYSENVKGKYIRIKTEEGEWELKHRFIASKMIGRKLTKLDRVIVKDGNYYNCSEKNISVIDHQQKKYVVCKKCRAKQRWNKRLHGLCNKCFFLQLERKLNIEYIFIIQNFLMDVENTILGRLFGVSDSFIFYIKNGRKKGSEMNKVKKPEMKKPVWEVLMDKYDLLAKQARACAYDRFKILLKIYEMKDFQKHCKDSSIDPEDYMDEKVDMSLLNFTNIRDMMEAFPNKKSWEKNSLRKLKEKTQESIISNLKPKNNTKPDEERFRPSLAQYRELEQKYKEALSKIAQLESHLIDKERLIKTLELQIQKMPDVQTKVRFRKSAYKDKSEE